MVSCLVQFLTGADLHNMKIFFFYYFRVYFTKEKVGSVFGGFFAGVADYS